VPSLCRDCDATCCRHYTIPITHLDIARVIEGTGMPPDRFVALEDRDVAAQMPLVYLDGQPAQLVLARAADTDACVFLDPVQNRCTIHAHAPAICSIYPFELTGDDPPRLRRRHDVYCAQESRANDEEREQAREAAGQFWTQDIDAYRRLVQRWNFRGAPGGLGAFLEYVVP